MTMTAETLREIRPGSPALAGELAMIEFQSQVPSAKGAVNVGPNAVHSWLEGQSSSVERLRSRATAAGRDDALVALIHGEAGSGKFRVAQWIHRCSRRASRPLMVLDGGGPTIEAQLARVVQTLNQDSEFTPGTLAIRDFHKLPTGAIQRLLEVLTIQGAEPRCGLALMTARDIADLRAISLQHAQLLGRVANAVIAVPALRSRSGDIALLARNFVQESSSRYGKKVRGISPQAIARLEGHSFPGNVHELRAVIEQAVLHSSGDWITAECFPGIGEAKALQVVDQAEVVIRLPGSSLREIEVQALRLALKLSGGRIVRASELLGITRHALRRKLEKFGLNDLRQHYEHGAPEVSTNQDASTI